MTMSDFDTTPTTTGDEYRNPNTTGTRPPMEIIDADAIDMDDDAAPQESTLTLMPEQEDGAEEINPVAEYVRENMPVNLTDDTRTTMRREEAQELTQRIRVEIVEAAEARQKLCRSVEQAYAKRVWIALDYAPGQQGWIKYCAKEFAPLAVRMTARDRKQTVIGFDPDSGLSNRAIAAVLGVSEATIRKDRRAAAADKPRPIVGVDGKRYSMDEVKNRQDKAKVRRQILELNEQGVTQEKIGEMVGRRQSTISEIISNERKKQSSERIAPAITPEEIDAAALRSDEPVTSPDDGIDETREYYVTDMANAFSDVDTYLRTLTDRMQDDDWTPGGDTTDEIVSRSFTHLDGILDNTGMLIRLLAIGDRGNPIDNLSTLLGDDKAATVIDRLDEIKTAITEIIG